MLFVCLCFSRFTFFEWISCSNKLFFTFLEMLTPFEGYDRANWRLPCFQNEEYIILSDSQFRDIVARDLERIETSKFFYEFSRTLELHFHEFIKLRRKSGNSMIFFSFFTASRVALICNLTVHWVSLWIILISDRNENLVVCKGASIPDIMNLVCLGSASRYIGGK